MYSLKSLIPITASILLAACSGSGGDGVNLGGPSDGDSTDGGDSSTNVALVLGVGSGDTFEEGQIDLGVNTLSAGGQTTVAVNVIDTADNSIYSAESTTITFSSPCASSGDSTLPSSSTTDTGTVQITYQAVDCQGVDSIRAELSNGSTANATILIAPADAGQLSFTSATPTTIALQNLSSSGIPTEATFQFTVTDLANQPLEGENVSFELSGSAGGATLVNTTAPTDANGIAIAIVRSGTTKGSVRVSASLDSNPALQTTSDAISIGTGIATQASFSLSADRYNPPAGIADGEEIEITVRLSDFYNNPIADGSKVIFFTSAGQIDPECEILGGEGACTAIWRSQNPKPPMDNTPSGPYDGRFSIMATVKGEETTLSDENSNGLFDSNSEGYEPLPEAFVDANWDGVRTPNGPIGQEEKYVDWNGDNTYTDSSSLSDKFRGVRCTDASKAEGHCAALADIFVTESFSYSGLTGGDDISYLKADGITPLTPPINLNTDSFFYVVVADSNGNAPADGTKVEMTIDGGDRLAYPAGGDVSNRTIVPEIFPVSIIADGISTESILTVKITNTNNLIVYVPVGLVE